MNQYHIYEAIGRGKYSSVYKGRKKKSIEYYAIKSVDKSQKNKVLHEVRILHSLDHPNVLKFYAWYETSAHLWLVLEYCVGGDLLTLLRQDGRLPEDSIHDLAHGLVKALQFLHSGGIIYADLKPSNILLDENGHTKLCDFGLARKLSDISKIPSSALPQAKRGTPYYMAPELFEDGGVHSYASDFWALGCVLYECYTGKPPFVAREFTQLVKSILSDPTPSLPGNPSRSFVNLINSLLVKDPAERLQWPELCEHAFWRTRFSPVPLPPQPAFDGMIELSSRPLSERNGDKAHQNETPSKSRDKDARGPLRQDENSNTGSRVHETQGKGTLSSRKNVTKPSGRMIEEKHKDLTNGSKRVNLLRLSRIAKSNLKRENEKDNYRRPMPKGSENDTEVQIENTDMELDFDENHEDEVHEDSDAVDSAAAVSEEKLSSQNQRLGKTEEMDNLCDQVDNIAVVETPTSVESKTINKESPSEHVEVAATPPSIIRQLKTHNRVKEGLGFASDFDASKPVNNLSQVLWHLSDLSVRPVMPSRKADKSSGSIPSLPFEVVQACDFVKLSKEQLEIFNNRIISIFSGNSSIGEKQNVIRYLETLSTHADAANILTNGPIMLLLVKMLRQSKTSVLRVQLASLIGCLIRHATFIEDDLANSGILGSLTDCLRDRQEKVRRFSMAALGELLFYISTQNEQTKDSNQSEPSSKDSKSAPAWQVSNSLISLVTSILRKGEDDITQLYALRTIENIFSQGGNWVSRYTSQDVISNLCYIYRGVGKQESMRLTAGSCLVRLVRFNPSSIQSVMEKLSFKDIASALVKGSPREQQISLNLLSTAMLASHMLTSIGRCLLPLMEDKNLVQGLFSLIEQGSEVLRGKGLVFVALLCRSGKRWLAHFLCNARFLSAVDRLAKEKDRFVQHCLDAFVHVVVSTVPGLLEVIYGDIQQIIGGRRHGHMSPLTNRAAPRTNVHFFPVVLHLLGSLSFKRKVVSHQVMQQLANLTKLTETPFQGRDDFQITLLRVLESIAEESAVILENSNIFIHGILPSLTVIYKGNKDGDARFLCLKILFDVMVIFLTEPSDNEKRLDDLRSISNVHLLPLYPTLIEDEDPIPTYAQKLLVMLIEYKYIKIADFLHLKTVSQCFEFLRSSLSNANVNDVKLCLALASAPEMESQLLSQLKVVRKIGNLLEFVYAKGMEDFLEPTLGLCRAFLLRSVGSKKGFSCTSEPALLIDCSSEPSGPVDQQHCIRDIMDFGCNVGVLLELSACYEATIVDMASECLILLFKAAPREATTSFLTNLPKVSHILESWRRGASHLLVQRILHALGYSCRQYLQHAMILSISISEIPRIQAILSELKCSNAYALSEAASLVSQELQRLPRCV